MRAHDRAAGWRQKQSAEIGFDLGFAMRRRGFSRFFIASGVVPPSAYPPAVSQVWHTEKEVRHLAKNRRSGSVKRPLRNGLSHQLQTSLHCNGIGDSPPQDETGQILGMDTSITRYPLWSLIIILLVAAFL